MNNKGFVFIETIIVTVVLTTTLIFLYSNFNKNLNNEKKTLSLYKKRFYPFISIKKIIWSSLIFLGLTHFLIILGLLTCRFIQHKNNVLI